MHMELRPIVSRLNLERETIGGRDMWTGRRHDTTVVAARIGVGPAAALASTAAVLDAWPSDHVLIAGVAGALDDSLRIGDLVRPEWAMDAGGARSTASPAMGSPTASSIRRSRVSFATSGAGAVTVDGWCDSDELRMHRANGAVIVDMETASVAQVCDSRRVPWSACRAVSDRIADGIVDQAIAGLVRGDGRPDLAAVTRYLAPAPWRVARLVRVARDTGRATAALAAGVADALGW